ncbi:MAG: zinc-binding alcohol dehydrogenase [Geminicoccaceae bacterium]
MTKALAYWSTGPFAGEIREERLAEPGPGEVRVETLFTALSAGTERLVAAGLVPPGEHERMRCPFQSGDFPFPVKYGYCNVGRVTLGPPALLGKTVFSLFPHQDRFNIPASMVHVLPEGLPPERAVLAANMETALNGIWDSGAAPGDRIQVIGAGVVGLLVAFIASRIAGTEVRIDDIDPKRLEAAKSLGIATGEAVEADIVFHCSGSEAGLVRALGLAGLEGTVVEMSWHGSKGVMLPLGEAFHSRRLRLVGSQVGRVPANRAARWNLTRRMNKALDLLCELPLDPRFSSRCGLFQLPLAVTALALDPCHKIIHLIRYDVSRPRQS